MIDEGHVRVEGRTAKANLAMRSGDVVHLTLPDPVPSTAAAEDIPVPILYEDADLVVVNKPAGMVVHPAPGHSSDTLVNALLYHVDDLSGVGGELRPGIVHRLDKGTSGVMVVAKHDAAHEALAAQFEERTVEKDYVALVWGVVQAGRRIDLPTGRDSKDRQKMSARSRRARRRRDAQHQGRAPARRHALPGGDSHRPHPPDSRAPERHLPRRGRRRDVRRPKGARRAGPGSAAAARPAVPHAERLAFRQPTGGRPMSFEAPLPEDLQGILDELRAIQGDG